MFKGIVHPKMYLLNTKEDILKNVGTGLVGLCEIEEKCDMQYLVKKMPYAI